MSYLDLYKTRVNINGDNLSDIRTNHAIYEFENYLLSAPNKESITINNVDYDVVVQTTERSGRNNVSKILFRINSQVNIGDSFILDNNNYLIINKKDRHIKSHLSFEMQLCNSQFPLTTTTKTVIGYDEFGKPVPKVTATTTYVPCIAETTIYNPDDNQAINLPKGQMRVTIPYSTHEDVATGKEFTMYDETYEIIGLDKTKSINGIGLIIITGQKR